MPRESICPEPGCGKRHPGKGRCPEHRKTREKQDYARRKALGTRWIYISKRWVKGTRPGCLGRDGWRCRARDETGGRCTHVDRTGRTLHAHHYPLTARQLLDRGLDPFDLGTVVTLCHSHHSQTHARA